jgi:hypothetical protein
MEPKLLRPAVAAAGAQRSPEDSSSNGRENTGNGAEWKAASTAIEFLRKLRPHGPWVLTAIVPDGQIETITAKTPDEADRFIRKHDSQRNLYYALNPLRHAVTKKATKTDVAAIVALRLRSEPG